MSHSKCTHLFAMEKVQQIGVGPGWGESKGRWAAATQQRRCARLVRQRARQPHRPHGGCRRRRGGGDGSSDSARGRWVGTWAGVRGTVGDGRLAAGAHTVEAQRSLGGVQARVGVRWGWPYILCARLGEHGRRRQVQLGDRSAQPPPDEVDKSVPKIHELCAAS